MTTKSDFMELMMGVLQTKLDTRHGHCAVCGQYQLTDDEIAFIRTVADNIYAFAVADGMGRAFEAMRRDAKPENVYPEALGAVIDDEWANLPEEER